MPPGALHCAVHVLAHVLGIASTESVRPGGAALCWGRPLRTCWLCRAALVCDELVARYVQTRGLCDMMSSRLPAVLHTCCAPLHLMCTCAGLQQAPP